MSPTSASQSIPPSSPRSTALALVVLLVGAGVSGLSPVGAVGALAPDLRVVALDVTPASPTEGDVVTIVATVVNEGNDVARSFAVQSYADGVAIGEERTVLLLGPGESVETTTTWTATGGRHVLSVVADARSSVAESDEGDNARQADVDVAWSPKSDLVLVRVWSEPEAPTVGSTAVLFAEARNVGDVVANTTIRLAVDDAVLGTSDALWLGPGESTTFSTPFEAASVGQRLVRATADPAGLVAESDETNNEVVRWVNVRADAPDAVALGLVLVPSAPMSGEPVHALFTFANDGPRPIPGFLVDFWLDGVALGVVEGGALDPGATAQVLSPSWVATEGSHAVTAAVNGTNPGDEGHDAGNSASTSYTSLSPPPAPKPDLTIPDLRLDPVDPRAGDIVDVVVTIANPSSAWSWPTSVQLTVDGVVHRSLPLGPLAPGATVQEHIRWNATDGTHAISAEVDPAGSVDEASESNNRREASTSVGPRLTPKLPDLVVASLTASGDRPSPGETVEFVARVVNQGEAASGTFRVRFIVDRSTQLGDAQVVFLQAGEATSVTSADWQAIRGDHEVAAIVDPEGLVGEVDESNNERSSAFAVHETPSGISPDLDVVSVHLLPASPAQGDAVTFEATLANNGATPAAARVRFSLDETLLHETAIVVAPGSTVTVASPAWASTGGFHVVRVVADPDELLPEADELNNDLQERFYVRVPDLRVVSVAPTDGHMLGTLEYPFQAVIENVAYDVDVGASTLEDFEVLGTWTPALSGGWSFVNGASAGYSTSQKRSGSNSVHVAWSGGAADGSDWGQTKLTRDFPATRVDSMRFHFRVDQYTGAGDPYDDLEAGIRLTPLDAQGTARGPAREYWVAAWFHCCNTKSPGANERLVSATPPLNTWITVDVSPTSDFGIDWTGTSTVRVEVFAEASGTYGDSFSMYVDDLDLGTGHRTAPGGAASGPTTLTFTVDGSQALGELEVPAMTPGTKVTILSPAWTAIQGDHTIRANVDPQGLVREVVETNNAADRAFHVFGPDLVVEGLLVAPPAPLPGDALTISGTVRNLGAPAAATTLRIELDGVALVDLPVPALGPAAGYPFSASAGAAVGGDHVARARADFGRVVAEEIESNNVATKAFHVALPDLSLTALRTSGLVDFGQPLVFFATVQNVGATGAPASALRLTLDGAFLAELAIPALGAGASVELESPAWTSVGGFHTVAALADPTGSVVEEKETDNARSLGFFVRQPDLTVGSIQAGTPTHGEPTTFTATVQNLAFGLPDLGSTSDDLETIALWTTRTIGNLGSPEMGYTTIAAASPIQSLRLGFNGGNFGELNNERTFPVSRVDELQVSFLVDRYSHNGGGFDDMRSGILIVLYDAQGARIEDYHYWFATWYRSGSVRPGEPGQITLYAQPPMNQWTTVTLSPTTDFGIDWRNVATIKLQTTISASGTSGDTTRMFFDDVLIKGLMPGSTPGSAASPATKLRFQVGTTTLPDVDVPPLAPGESVAVKSPSWTAIGGDHTLKATVDPLAHVREFSEPNNVASASVHVTQADLSVISAAASTTPLDQGMATTFVATVKNLGDAPAAATSTRLTLDGTTDLGTYATPALAPGATTQIVTSEWTATGGDHTLRVDADALAVLPEKSETNNGRTQAIHVRWPDLKLALAAPSPQPEDHTTTTLRATVANLGDGAAPASLVRFEVGDVPIGDVATPSIAAGQAATVTLDWLAVGGDRVVRATVDPAGALPEASETNNLETRSIRVLRSDVSVTGLVATPAGPAHGDATRFAATVTNTPQTLPGVFNEDFETPSWTPSITGGASFMSGATARYETVKPLSGASSVHVRFNGGCCGTDAGEAKMGTVVPLRSIDTLRFQFHIVNGEWGHGAIQPGDTLEAGVRFTLLDDAGAPIGPSREYWIGAWTGFSFSKTPGPNERLLSWRPYPHQGVPPFFVWVPVEVHPTSDFGMSWAGTRSVRVEFFVEGTGTSGDTVGFYVDDLQATSQSPIVEGATARDFTVRFFVDGTTEIGEVQVASLAPGASIQVESPAWSALGGGHVVRAVADAGGVLAESDEANNAFERSLHVTRADLVAGALTTTPEIPVNGGTFRPSVVVTNGGDAAAGAFLVRFAVDGTTVGEASVSGLAPGASRTIEGPATTAVGGDHVASAAIDAADAVSESDEANNAASRALHVAHENLQVAAVGTSLDPVHTGDRITFWAVVRNVGDAPAPASSLRFLLDDGSGTTFADLRVGPLAPGASANVTSGSWKSSKGSHTIAATADVLGEVAEANESDNALSLAFAVEPIPDLVVDAIAIGPNDPPRTGDSVTFVATVRNAGDAGARPFVASFYVDGALVGTASHSGLAGGGVVQMTSPAWIATLGLHQVRVVVDSGGDVPEGIETNNERTREFASL